MECRFSRVLLLVQQFYNGAEEGLQDHIFLKELSPGWPLQYAFPKAISRIPCKQRPEIVFLKGKILKGLCTQETEGLCPARDGGMEEALLFFFWWLMKIFHQSLLHLFMENIRLQDHAGQISLPVRLQDHKHCGRSPRNAHSRAYLPSSGLSTVRPLTSWISCQRGGERVDGKGEGAEDLGMKQSARGSSKLLPATWQRDAGKWAASPTDSNLSASSACTQHTSPAKHRELWLCIPIHVFCNLRHSSSLPVQTRASALWAVSWAAGWSTMTASGRWTPEVLQQHHPSCCSTLCLCSVTIFSPSSVHFIVMLG